AAAAELAGPVLRPVRRGGPGRPRRPARRHPPGPRRRGPVVALVAALLPGRLRPALLLPARAGRPGRGRLRRRGGGDGGGRRRPPSLRAEGPRGAAGGSAEVPAG